MQMLESLLSFAALLSLAMFLSIHADAQIDNSLYIYELQGDAKNVIYLKGGFENLTIGNEIAMEILEKTGMCIEMGQTDLTSKLVSDSASSSRASVPRIREGNLSGFVQDEFRFGPCDND